MTQAVHTRSAVLFLIFNRPDTTAKVFERIRAARPPRLYIAADGPRLAKPGEETDCRLAREAAGPVDWPCQVKTLFREKNLGCKDAVSSAIDWFFQHEEEGIILEDDCLPSPDFFLFCDTLLEHHRHSTSVRHICGCNLQFGQQRGAASYYYSRLTHVWGWASWRRVWQDYDKNLSLHPHQEITSALTNAFSDPLVVAQWTAIATDLRANKIDTWDYQLSLANMVKDGLCIIPNSNLITNIGFGDQATHTSDVQARYANIPHAVLGTITHPEDLLSGVAADQYTHEEVFQLPAVRAANLQKAEKYNRLRYRIKRWLAAHGGPRRWSSAGN